MDEYVDVVGSILCSRDVKLYTENCSVISKDLFEYADRIKAYR